jgi:hypothetical protein
VHRPPDGGWHGTKPHPLGGLHGARTGRKAR